MLRTRIFHQQQNFNFTFLPSLHISDITAHPKTFVRRFSRCSTPIAAGSDERRLYSQARCSTASSCLQRYKSPNFSRLRHSRTIRTSSLLRTLSSLNDAFSDANKARVVQQLGLMKPWKSLLASCSEEAAVFVPFCVVDSTPSVLFTLRSDQLSSHRGEVSFPGGKKDPKDTSLVDTAIREMEEELGLERSHVQVWASMPAMPDRLGKTAITPVLGFIGEIDVNSLQINPEEVESVFTLSLEHLCNPVNSGYTKFTSQAVLPVFRNGPHKVWGLTAIILEQVLLVLAPENYPRQLCKYNVC